VNEIFETYIPDYTADSPNSLNKKSEEPELNMLKDFKENIERGIGDIPEKQE
jgi:hypothetical protein